MPKPIVLIAEDENAARVSLSGLITAEGFAVLEPANGTES